MAVTNVNGCSDTSAVFSLNALGVLHVVGSYGVKLYPNPNTVSFMLKFTNDVIRNVAIDDTAGRFSMASVKVLRKKNFNIEEVSTGIYIVRISQQGQVQNLTFALVR